MAKATSKKMTNAELSQALGDAERDSLSYLGSKLSKQRKDALKYYEAEPFDSSTGLQAVPGRSSVVMQEVADVIDWIMPDLLKKFASGDRAVEFQPNHEDGEAAAQQATAYVNYVFFHDNPGFMILHDMFQDALVQKNGIVKAYWDDKASDEIRTLNDLPADALALLKQDPDAEIISEIPAAVSAGSNGGETSGYGEAGPAPAEPTFDVRYRVKEGRCCIENVPPEYFLMARDGKRIATTAYCGDRQPRSLSDLIAMGFDPEQVKSLPSDDDLTLDDEAAERRDGDDDTGSVVDRTGMMRQVWLSDHYILVDYDGDGIAERRRVITAGSSHTILREKTKDSDDYEDCNKPWDGPPPYASITPKPKSHRFFGRSIADICMDLQRISSMLTRQMLDNLYLSNNPRNVVSDKVNLDDLMSPRLGSFIRLVDGALPKDGHVQPITLPFVAKDVIPVMEFMNGVKENRTGVTKYNQGTDADSLNKTARGITQIMSAAQQRIELIARIFAETGVSDMFMLIMQCVAKYQDKPRVVKVSGKKWEAIDPRGWESMFKMQINVGLGTGNKDQQLMHLQTIGEMQEKIVMAGNPGGIVSPENVYNVGRKMVENAGLKDAELFFTDPAKNQQQPPKPDPAMAKVENDAKAKQAELQLKSQGQQAELALKAKGQQDELALKQQGMVLDHQMRAQGQQADQQMAQHGQHMDHQRQVDGAEADRSLQREGMQSEQQGKSDDVSRAVEQVGKMLEGFMAKQQERDQRQDQTIADLAAKLMPQANGAVQ